MANKFSKEIEKVENYENAKKENFCGWNCHHRLETHNSDGEKRLVQLTRSELQALNMYYDRPANELIFLTIEEHTGLHSRPCSEEQKRKTSNALKGHFVSDGTKEKISKTLTGRDMPEEIRKKISIKTKGGNITSFKKGYKAPKERIERQKIAMKKTMDIKVSLYQNYKKQMTWNEFQTFYRLNKRRLLSEYKGKAI